MPLQGTLKYFAGVDPGLSGAIAMLGYGTLPNDGLMTIDIIDTPTFQITQNKKTKNMVDMQSMAIWLNLYAADCVGVNIERVAAMPKQGVTSVFNFGQAAGIVQGMFGAHQIPINFRVPLIWKRFYGLTSDKDSSRRKASELFPRFAHLWPRKGDDGKAEAVLLAALTNMGMAKGAL